MDPNQSDWWNQNMAASYHQVVSPTEHSLPQYMGPIGSNQDFAHTMIDPALVSNQNGYVQPLRRPSPPMMHPSFAQNHPGLINANQGSVPPLPIKAAIGKPGFLPPLQNFRPAFEAKPITTIIRTQCWTDIQPPVKNHIGRFPEELLLKLFMCLEIDDSLCFGLASYRMYLFHRRIHHRVLIVLNEPRFESLRYRLRDIMLPGFVYWQPWGRFVRQRLLNGRELKEAERVLCEAKARSKSSPREQESPHKQYWWYFDDDKPKKMPEDVRRMILQNIEQVEGSRLKLDSELVRLILG